MTLPNPIPINNANNIIAPQIAQIEPATPVDIFGANIVLRPGMALTKINITDKSVESGRNFFKNVAKGRFDILCAIICAIVYIPTKLNGTIHHQFQSLASDIIPPSNPRKNTIVVHKSKCLWSSSD